MTAENPLDPCLDCRTSSRGKCVIHLEQEPVKHDCTKEECRQLFDNTSDETDRELERLREALEAAARSLESIGLHWQEDFDAIDVQAYARNRALVARAAINPKTGGENG